MPQPDFRAAAEYLSEQGLFTPDRFFELAMSSNADELDISLGYAQRMPRAKIDPIWQELAAKHLPKLVEQWRTDGPGPITTTSVLINVITYTPYFARFIRSPAGAGMAALQAKRAADAEEILRSASEKNVAEVFQFLSTLLLLQMDIQFGTDVEPDVKKKLIPLLKELRQKREFRGKLGSETAERVLGVLSDDPRDHQMRPPLLMMKATLESPLKICGVRDCEAIQQGKELMKCGRCKTAVYCGPEHQKQSWPQHKKQCFTSSF